MPLIRRSSYPDREGERSTTRYGECRADTRLQARFKPLGVLDDQCHWTIQEMVMTVRTADDVSVFCALDPLGAATGHYKMFLKVGARTHVAPRRITLDQLQYMEERSHHEPVAYLRVVKKRYWRIADVWVLADESDTASDVRSFLEFQAAAEQGPADFPRQRSESPELASA